MANNINGTKGTKGKNGAKPTAGGDGGDATYSLNGSITSTFTPVDLTGGDGGAGGNGTSGPGANGGNGGNANGTVSGSIFTPTSSPFDLSITATGGNGGNAGTGTVPGGSGGNGGSGSVFMSGDVIQASSTLSDLSVIADAVGGLGGGGSTLSQSGNATATLNGDIIQYSGSAPASATVEAIAQGAPGDSTAFDGNPAWGSKTATITGSIVQGNLNNVWVSADAEFSNGSATLTGNVIQTNTTDTGTVTLEATGQNIDIEQNKVTLGKQAFDLTVNELGNEYSDTIKGNTFTGNGSTSTFVFTDNANPGPSPTPDTVTINLTTQTFVFDGNSNKLKGFENVTVAGNNDPTVIGDNNANVLTGGGANDTFEGLGGNDTINGGGGVNTAIYQGNFAQYNVSLAHTGNLAGTVTDTVAGRDGTDSLQNIQYLQFSDGTYNVATGVFTSNAPANHAPAGTNGTVTTLEDTPYVFKAADFGFTDPNDNPPNSLMAVEITTLPTAGTLTDNGAAVTAGEFVSVGDINNGLLQFAPAANANGTDYASFTFQVEDNGGTANGGQNLDPTPNTMTVNVTSVNDAPVGTNGTVTTLEDTPYVFKAADFGFTDPNDNPPNSLMAVEITTLPTHGTLTDNGVAVTAGQFVSAADIANGLLQFAPAANANGAAYANFTFQVEDNGGTANGGQNLDPNPKTMTVNVTSVNDAPVGTSGSVTTLEDTPYVFQTSDFGFTDPNDNPPNSLMAVEITTLPTAGMLTDNGVAVTAGQFVSAADIANGLLQFAPAANANGAAYANFTFQVEDNGGTANGGQNLDPNPKTMTVNVTSVNDAPVGTSGSVTTLEDTPYVFQTTDFGFTDPNDNPPNSLMAVEITTLPTAGTLTDNGVAVTAGQFVSAADIAAGKLVFASAPNANGTDYANFTFQVEDNGGTANGGQNLDPNPKTLTVNVTSVNDAPVGTSNTINARENTSYTFAASDFGFTDPNDNPPNSFMAVEITTLPTAGSLTDNGVAVTAGQFVSVADINNHLLQFTPAANASGTDYASFTFQVEDNGGTANGGVNTDPNPKTMTMNVAPILVVGPGGYASINAAIAAANPGDTILIAAGTYNENVVVNKAGITLQGQGPGVVIEGTFTQTNGNFTGPLATWLQTAAGYSGASGTGVTVSADNVTLNNITVDNFLTGVSVSGPSVSGLTLEGVTTSNSVFGFTKPDDTAVNGLTIDGSTFTDEYIGAGFFNDSGATGGAGAGQDATNTSITNSNFSNIDEKGIYMETAQGNTNLDGLTMNNVGQYGGVPSFGANGLNGNGIDINLKYHTYTGNLTIQNFNLTNTGLSDGAPPPVGVINQNGAIVVEGRDDPSSYNTIPADVSGLNVTIENGTINGTSTGIRAGENKANPAQNDTGPAVTIDGVTITNATVADIDNHTNSLMTVNGTNGDDTYISAQTAGSTGPMDIFGMGGNDTLEGGLGNDLIDGGPGNDTIIASAGNDTYDGGTGTNTLSYANAPGVGAVGVTVDLSNPNPQAVGGGYGTDTVSNFQNLTGSAFNDTLTGDANNNVIMAGGGDDTVFASAGNDTYDGGTGTNTLDYSLAPGVGTVGVTVDLSNPNPQAVGGGFGTDTITNFQNLNGSAFDDTLTGNAGNNVIMAGAGDDTIIASAGNDTYDGGTGTNTLSYFNAPGLGTSGVTVDLSNTGPQAVGGGFGTDTISNIQVLIGSNYNDFLADSGSGGETLNGGGGNDVLYSRGGANNLNGGAGTDVAYYDGRESQYLAPTLTQVAGGPDAVNDTLTGIERLKFLSPSHVSDVDDNGFGDLVFQNASNGNVQIRTQPGAATVTVNLPTALKVIGTGQFTPDTDRDAGLLVQNTTNNKVEIVTALTGTPVTTVLSQQPGAGWAPVSAGDFNGDAASDVLMYNSTTGATDIMFLNENAGEAPGTVDAISSVTAPNGVGWKPIAAGDFNGDGKSDILWQNGGAGGPVEITLMNGATVTNTATVPLATSAGYTAVGTGDFNNDGKSDILFSTGGAGAAAEVWTMNGDSMTGSFSVAAPGAGFTLMGAEDVNNDGYSDLLWQNATNGNVKATELTAGGSVLATVTLGSPASTFHLIASTGGG